MRQSPASHRSASRLPSFWLAILLVVALSLNLHLFPATGARPFSVDPVGAIRHATLPAIALSTAVIAELARQVRSALIEVLNSQYVRTLRAKGLGPIAILWKHGLRNISVTLLTLVGLLVNRLLSGAVVIEAVFAIPGAGSLVAYSAINKDFPVVQGVVLVFVIMIIVINLARRHPRRAARSKGGAGMSIEAIIATPRAVPLSPQPVAAHASRRPRRAEHRLSRLAACRLDLCSADRALLAGRPERRGAA